MPGICLERRKKSEELAWRDGKRTGKEIDREREKERERERGGNNFMYHTSEFFD